MRFRRLDLEAFGPFTREELDLSGGAPGGLHVIYGPNEAGKSTSLRAVEGLLFGIPERSQDAHLHPSPSLAVGGVLERGQGTDREELWLTRRKRRKDSLVDRQGNPLPDDVLGPWLSGLDQRSFFARFGLDQTRLEQGAEALLGGGEEGLFAAGTAGPDVARLLPQLHAEETALYGPRAKRPLNRALTLLTEAGRSARQAARPPEKWREQKRAHQQALERVQTLREERARLKLEQGRLNRLAAVRSDVARWVGATEELEQLGPQPELPVDSESRRTEAQRAYRDAQREVARLSDEVQELTRRMGELPPPSSLLQVEGERWEALERKIGWEHKAREDRPKLEGELAARLDELRRHLARLGKPVEDSPLAQADALRIEAALERRAQRLSARHAQLELAVRETKRQLDDMQGEHAVVLTSSRDAAQAGDVDALELAVSRGRQVLAQLVRKDALLSEREHLAAKAARRRSELGTRTAAAELVEKLPTEVETTQAQSEAEALCASTRRLAEAREEQQSRYDQAAAVLVAQERAGEVPSEARLAELRQRRDEHFDGLGAAGAEPTAVRLWAEELLARIAEADHAADRLRLEAHRVSEREKQLSARETARAALERFAGELVAAQARLGQLGSLWAKRWAHLGGGGIELTQLATVRQRVVELIELEEQLRRREDELAALREESVSASTDLLRALGERGRVSANLVDLVELATQCLAEARQERERRRTLRGRAQELAVRIEQQKTRAVEAEQRLLEWQGEWEQALGELRLSFQTPPDEVQAVLAELTELGRIADEARGKQRRLQGIDRDTHQLAAQVRPLVERHAPDLRDLDALDAAGVLVARVRSAREVERDRARLETEVANKRQALTDSKRAGESAWATLDELMQAAGVADPAELGPVEQRARRVRELSLQRAQLEDVLRSKAGSGSPQELITEARGVSPLELSAQCDEIEARLEDLEEELRAGEYDASATEAGLELYQSEDAAVAQQRLAGATAEARQVLRDFLVLRTARLLLHREVTRYAERYQGPILARANVHFPRLTMGRYSALRVGVGERTLRCVRDGKEIEVGELSRGTRAQLYLALRLASLEHHFERRPTVPLIFDDLLVDFDDDRACAAFEILGELAERVQILYFTHLGRDLHAARDAVPAQRLFEHRIGVLQPIARPA